MKSTAASTSEATYRCWLRSSLWSSSLVVNRWMPWRAAPTNDRVVVRSEDPPRRLTWTYRLPASVHCTSTTPVYNAVCGSWK